MSTLTPERRPATPEPPSKPPRRPAEPRRLRGRGRGPRWLALGALLIVAVVVIVLITRSDNDTYRLDFTNAGQLVTGDLVRIGGTPAGTVTSIHLTDDGQAQVAISLNRSFGPLRRGTTATIRNPGLTDVAARYIDISPAPSFRAALPSDAIIPTSRTSGIVDIDQLFNTLNARTRAGLRGLIRGFGEWYEGRSRQANATARLFPAALGAYTRVLRQLDTSTPSLDRFIRQTDVALGAIDRHAPALTDLVGSARTTVDALASDNRSLSQGLADLPVALRRGTGALHSLRTQALPGLTRLLVRTAPAIAPLHRLLPKLNPVLQESVPVFAELHTLLTRPGVNNDLGDALVELPTLARQVDGDFPRAITALRKGTPIFRFARPYFPDLVAWLVNWDGVFAPYDANGHYARTLPVFGAYQLAGNTLSPTPPSERGLSGLTTGYTDRCPGSAVVTGDGSSPYVDSGVQANAHCSAAQSAAGAGG